jgi:hypothetical protein
VHVIHDPANISYPLSDEYAISNPAVRIENIGNTKRNWSREMDHLNGIV